MGHPAGKLHAKSRKIGKDTKAIHTPQFNISEKFRISIIFLYLIYEGCRRYRRGLSPAVFPLSFPNYKHHPS